MRKGAKGDYLIRQTIKIKETSSSPFPNFSSEMSDKCHFIDESHIQALKERMSTYSDLRFTESQTSFRKTISKFEYTSDFTRNFNEYVVFG